MTMVRSVAPCPALTVLDLHVPRGGQWEGAGSFCLYYTDEKTEAQRSEITRANLGCEVWGPLPTPREPGHQELQQQGLFRTAAFSGHRDHWLASPPFSFQL